MRLLVWLAVYMLSLFLLRVLALALFFTSPRRALDSKLAWIGQSATLHLGFVISEAGVSLVLAGVIFRFYRYHLWLAKNNLTTFQHIMQSRSPKHPAHHKVVPHSFPEKIQQTGPGAKSGSEPSEGNEDAVEQSKDTNQVPQRRSSTGDASKGAKESLGTRQKPQTKQSADSTAYSKSLLVKQKLPMIHKKLDSPEI